jgi:hypothetical protein
MAGWQARIDPDCQRDEVIMCCEWHTVSARPLSRPRVEEHSRRSTTAARRDAIIAGRSSSLFGRYIRVVLEVVCCWFVCVWVVKNIVLPPPKTAAAPTGV